MNRRQFIKSLGILAVASQVPVSLFPKKPVVVGFIDEWKTYPASKFIPTRKFRRYSRLLAPTTPLAEGVVPTRVSLTYTETYG